MIRQEITYFKNSFNIKQFKEYSNGVLVKIENYNEKGELHGFYKISYSSNSELISKYNNSKLKWSKYYKNSVLLKKIFFNINNELSNTNNFDENGKIIKNKICYDE